MRSSAFTQSGPKSANGTPPPFSKASATRGATRITAGTISHMPPPQWSVPSEAQGVGLGPLTRGHGGALAKAAADGELWQLWFTSVPEPQQTEAYITQALAGRDAGHMLPFVVREVASGAIVGSTRYHDIIKEAERVEIGYTWYARRWQKTHVNSVCKLLLFGHAFEPLGSQAVRLPPPNFNF